MANGITGCKLIFITVSPSHMIYNYYYNVDPKHRCGICVNVRRKGGDDTRIHLVTSENTVLYTDPPLRCEFSNYGACPKDGLQEHFWWGAR